MISFYSKLFYIIYKFLQSFDGGQKPYQTIETRTFTTVMVISFLELFNLMSIFPEKIVRKQIIIPFVILYVVNFFIFYSDKKYQKIVEKYNKNNFMHIDFIITVSYVVITLLTFGLSR